MLNYLEIPSVFLAACLRRVALSWIFLCGLSNHDDVLRTRYPSEDGRVTSHPVVCRSGHVARWIRTGKPIVAQADIAVPPRSTSRDLILPCGPRLGEVGASYALLV